MTAPRYLVHDRAAGQASSLTNFSAVNPRYSILDTEATEGSSKIVDELVSARAARETVRDLNREAKAK